MSAPAGESGAVDTKAVTEPNSDGESGGCDAECVHCRHCQFFLNNHPTVSLCATLLPPLDTGYANAGCSDASADSPTTAAGAATDTAPAAASGSATARAAAPTAPTAPAPGRDNRKAQ